MSVRLSPSRTLRWIGLLLALGMIPACDQGDTFITVQSAPPSGLTGGGSVGSFAGGMVPGVIFRMDRNIDDVYELWAADLTGSVLVNLSGPLITGGQVLTFHWSPDRQWVVFQADKEVKGRVEHYVVPAVGGTPLKLEPLSFAEESIFDSWAPDSSRILYRVFDPISGETVVRTVRPDGTGRVDLFTRTAGEGFTQGGGAWAPDSQRLAFILYPAAASDSLVVIRADGTSTTPVTGPLVAGGNLLNFAWAPDGSRIAYVGDQDTDDVVELYSTLPGSAASILKLSGPLVAGGDIYISPLLWAPDASRIAFVGDVFTDNLSEIFTALPGTANSAVQVSAPLAPGASVLAPIAWAPDASRILYRTNDGTNRFDLFTTLPTSSASVVHVSEAPIPGGTGVISPLWSPDSTRIAYLADQTTAGTLEVYTAPAAAANASVAVSSAAPLANSDALLLQWAPDGSRLAYVGSHQSAVGPRPYTATPTIANNALEVPLPAGTNVQYIRWASASTQVICALNLNFGLSSDVHALYSVSTPAGPGVVITGAPLETAFMTSELDWLQR